MYYIYKDRDKERHLKQRLIKKIHKLKDEIKEGIHKAQEEMEKNPSAEEDLAKMQKRIYQLKIKELKIHHNTKYLNIINAPRADLGIVEEEKESDVSLSEEEQLLSIPDEPSVDIVKKNESDESLVKILLTEEDLEKSNSKIQRHLLRGERLKNKNKKFTR